MTEAEVQKLRDAGIGDDVILEMQKEEAGKKGQAAPTAEVASALPNIDPNTPSTVYQQAQAAGVPTEGREQTWMQTATEMAPALGNAVVAAAPYAAGAAGLYGGSRLLSAARTAADAYKTGVQTAADTAQRNVALQEARMAERAARAGGAPRPVVTTGPVTPAMSPAGAVPTAPAPGPIAPVGAAPAAPVAQAAETGVLNRAKQVVQQLALSKLAPMAANVLKGANVASLAGYSSDLGPKTPQMGRMKGMEINPLTNAPWTPEQIRQYEANPAVYDAQMAPPQFRR
jgi:hypothetical protein